MKYVKYFNVIKDRMERNVGLVKVISTIDEMKNLVKTLDEARVLVQEEVSRTKILNSCYVVIDKDGDFVDACSGRLPSNTLDVVINRVMASHPENAPFRLLKWNGYEFVEVTPVS